MAGSGFFLGIETSSIITGLALVKENEIHYELNCLTGSKHNETIYQLLTNALQFLEIKVAELSGIGVSIGPGMFTSLRVGLALAKGLALPYQIPVKGINTLDALFDSLIQNVGQNNSLGLVVPIIDARKDEVFAAIYRNNERISEYLLIKPLDLAYQISESVYFVGNGLKKYESSLKEMLPIGFKSVMFEAPSPSAIALRAQKSIADGEISDLASLQPFYLRPTDAELKRKESKIN